jgi:hypothetical protein
VGLVGQSKEEHPYAHQAEHHPFSFHLSVSFLFHIFTFGLTRSASPDILRFSPPPSFPRPPRAVDVASQFKSNVFPHYGIQGDAFGDVLHFLSAKADQNEMANSSWDIAEPVIH